MRGRLSYRAIFCTILVLSFSLLLFSCKKSSTDSVVPVERIAEGSYVGYGDLGDGDVNVWLAVLTEESEEDTSNIPVLSGSIKYGGQQEQLLEITTNADQDSLWLRYSYDGVIHRASSAITTTGLYLVFGTPTGLSNLRLNREIGGANMSGKWSGTMTSNYLQLTSSAEMIMDQQGTDFFGDIDADLSGDLHADINSGSSTLADFTLSGTGRYGSYSTDVDFWGQYGHQDTISGNWQLGDYDNGSFLFWREF